MASEPERTYPSELPVVALRETVVFPLTLQPLAMALEPLDPLLRTRHAVAPEAEASTRVFLMMSTHSVLHLLSLVS